MSAKPYTREDYRLALGSAKSGDLETIRCLVEHNKIDPKDEDSELLRVAAEHQNPEIVEYLIPLTDPKALGSLALRWACEKPGIECIKLLLPHSDPTQENSAALRLAVTYGNYEGAKLLFDLCDPQKALNELLDKPGQAYGRKNVPEKFVQWWEEHEAHKLKTIIEENIATAPVTSAKKKM